MKKYQQLLIVSLGLVSFICFLIYKHEYDRLRNVLEVLEVFGSPQTPGGVGVGNQNDNVLRSHPLEFNHNPALGAGSINELNLGGAVGGGGNNAQLAYDARQDPAGNPPLFDDTFVLKNGHGVRPPDNDEPANNLKRKSKGEVIQNPGSGEVVDNMADEAGGGGGVDGDGVIGGKFGALKTNKKTVQRLPQDSIFKEKHQQKEQGNEV